MSEPAHFAVRNWRRFQHYSKRNPPWIKLHFELLNSRDWVSLDDASRVLAVACMLIASRNNGMVPNNPDYLSRVAYLNQPPDFKPLIVCGFLTEIDTLLADASVSVSVSVSASTSNTNITSFENVAREKEASEKESEPHGSAHPSTSAVNGRDPKKLDFTPSSALLGTKLMREARH